MLKISYAGCLGLSLAILAQFTLEMRVAAENREKKFTKTPILGVKGDSRSSMLTFLRRSSPVLVVISNMPVPMHDHFMCESSYCFQRVLAIAILSVRPSVCPSVTRMDQSKSSPSAAWKTSFRNYKASP